MAGCTVYLSTSIWVNTVSRCMNARQAGMSKARTVRILALGSANRLRAAISIASGLVRWEMPMARVSPGQVQHVAALDVGVEVAVVVAGDQALEVGMILKDVIRVDGLTAAGGETHLVQEHAGAHRSEGVAGEVEIGQGSTIRSSAGAIRSCRE